MISSWAQSIHGKKKFGFDGLILLNYFSSQGIEKIQKKWTLWGRHAHH